MISGDQSKKSMTGKVCIIYAFKFYVGIYLFPSTPNRLKSKKYCGIGTDANFSQGGSRDITFAQA